MGPGISNEFNKEVSKITIPKSSVGTSIFDQVILQVKMQIQEWFINKFQISNPILLLFITYAILYPEKSYSDIVFLFSNMYLYLKYVSMLIVSLIFSKPTPKKILLLFHIL
jgi:hypothetical protein